MYAKTTRLKLSDIQRHRALFDFLNALRIVDVAFVIDRETILKDKIHRNENLSTLKDLLKNFRNHLRTTRALISLMTNDNNHSTFATFQNNSSDDHSHDEKFNLKCLCEENHLYRNCLYILIKNRSSEWKSNPKIEALVIEKIAKSELIRQTIYMTKKLIDENTTDLKFKNFNFAKFEKFTSASIIAVFAILEYDESAAFASTFSEKSYLYKLQNCWTLNCDIDIHICNNRRRFNLTRVVDLDDMIMIDKIIYAIEKYETMNIMTQKLNEQSMSIKLLNVILVSDFLTNLVCLSKFIEKEIHWDIENNRLHRNESTFCHTQSMSDHWVLKKNLIDQNQTNIDIKSDKRSFQAFAIIIIIIESMSSENIKLASNHQNAADFQISVKTSQHLIIELIVELNLELIVELIFEWIVELISELITELISELNTKLFTASNHEMNLEIETSESYETAANHDHSSSFITIMLKLKRYVERKHFTSDENRLIMPQASIWWRRSDDAVLRLRLGTIRFDSVSVRFLPHRFQTGKKSNRSRFGSVWFDPWPVRNRRQRVQKALDLIF